MAQNTSAPAGARARPDEGWQKFTVIASVREKSTYGLQLKLGLQWHGPKGLINFSHWLQIHEPLTVDDPIVKLVAACRGQVSLPVDTEFDDETEPPKHTVLSLVEHYMKGPKAKTPGAPSWKLTDFKPVPREVVSKEAAVKLREAMVVAFPDEKTRAEKVAAAIQKAVGHSAKTNELMVDEADKVWALLEGVAVATGVELPTH